MNYSQTKFFSMLVPMVTDRKNKVDVTYEASDCGSQPTNKISVDYIIKSLAYHLSKITNELTSGEGLALFPSTRMRH